MARAAVLGAFAVVALSACNAILGMEHARLDEDVDSGAPANHGSGGKPGGMPSAGGSGAAVAAECSAPSDACGQCVQSKCATQMTACLGSPDCRKAVEAYGKCVGANCSNGATCGEALATSADPTAAALGLCLSGCADCAKGTAISMCEPYCRCMKDQCSDQFRLELGGEYAKCVENCKSKGDILANVDCRAAHCEFAPDDPTLHCKHAVGMGFCPLPDPNDTLVCTSGIETGYPCHKSEECCSVSCQRQVCVSAD